MTKSFSFGGLIGPSTSWNLSPTNLKANSSGFSRVAEERMNCG